MDLLLIIKNQRDVNRPVVGILKGKGFKICGEN
jgi:hypothetical protein